MCVKGVNFVFIVPLVAPLDTLEVSTIVLPLPKVKRKLE